MAAHLHEWLALALRWAHLVTGIAWIGASFYFNWLENRLRREDPPEGYAGDLWAVHGGGFYYLRKLAVAPGTLPPELHWFKWEAYWTWLTGFALLWVVFYWNASAFMLNPDGPALAPWQAVTIGLAALAVSWFLYDGLCRLLAERHPELLALLLLAWFTVLAWGLGDWLSARAAFIHVGAAIGTVMVANVFRVIIPAQKDLVAAVVEGREPDAGKGRKALLRSRHNNYLTLPVLFIMISAHFPSTYGHPQAWAVLLGISLGGVAIRHWFNVRHLEHSGPGPLIFGIALLLVTLWLSAPAPVDRFDHDAAGGPADTAVKTAEVLAVIRQRCTSCHSATPTQPGFAAAPLGIMLDTAEDLARHRQRVYQSVAARTMPLGNLTQMTDEERRTVVHWYLGRD